MAKKISKPEVEALNDLQVNALCRLYGQPYGSRGGTVSEKAERVWHAIVQRTGGITADAVEVAIPNSVWRTAVEVTRYLPKTELAARLRAHEVLSGEEPFELPGSEGTVSAIVQQWENATPRKGQRSTQDTGASTSGAPIGPAVVLATGEQAGAHMDEDMFDADDGGSKESQDEEEWKLPKRARKSKKSKKKADRRRPAQSGDAEQGPGESEGKSIQDMDALKSKDRSGQGSSKVQDTLALLQNVSPSLETVCSTLRAVKKELRKSQRDPARDLELADRAEQSLALVQAFLAGMGAERVRGALKETDSVRETQKKESPHGHQRDMGRKWSEVAAALGPRTPPRPPQFEWDPSRTVFLVPENAEEARRPISAYAFGRHLQACFANVPGFETTANPAVKRIERTPTNGWKVLLAPGAVEYLPRGAFVVPTMGTWKPEPMRSPSSASVVIYGVPTDLEDQHVEMFLKQGTRELVKEEDRERFEKLKVRRLFSRAPANISATEQGDRTPPESRITRSCRVYLPPDLAHYFVMRGEMMLRWVRLPCKEYIPRKFFCKHCNRLGSHSTQNHRSAVTPAASERPPAGGSTS